MGKLSKLSDDKLIDFLQEARQARDENKLEQFRVSMQAFVNKPKTVQKKIQAVGVSTDFAQLTKDAFNVTVEEDNFDLGWERAFRTVTLGKGQDAWEIYDVESGITFVLVEEGQRIEMNEMAGTKTTVYVDYYGGAIGWTDKMIRFRKVPSMINLAMAFRNKFWANKADNHYALLAAAGALNTIVYQGVAADGELQRDIQTINECAFQIGDANKDKGYGDTANARLIIYANPRDKDRINAANRSTTAITGQAGRTGVKVEWNIDVIYTFNSSITQGSPLMVLPGNKIQRADAMAPTTYIADKDPFTLNEAQAVWAIYGAAVGDTDQVYQFTLG